MECLISGTIAGKIVAELDKIPIDHNFVEDHELMRSIQRRCKESCFKRHKASPAMVVCTENEEPTFDALKGEEYVRNLYKVSLLQSIDHPVLGNISPDCIVIINGHLPFNGEIGCVTRGRMWAHRIITMRK